MFTTTDKYGETHVTFKGGCVMAVIVVVALLAILSLVLAIFFVPAGNVGVVTRWGAVLRVAYPGMGWKVPFSDGIVLMNIQTRKDQIDVGAASKDLQTVTATIAANYHLDPQYAAEVYQNIGANYADVIIAPAMQNTFKATTAQFTAEQLITERDTSRIKAEAQLTDQLKVYHVIVENFNIVNFDFSPEFNAAIEAKQVAQQQVEQSKQLLAKAQVDAQTVLTAAQGQANAQKALKDSGALTPEYLNYLFLQKWNGILPQVMGGANSFVDVSKYLDTQPVPAK